MITLVVGVIDLGVEKFHYEDHIIFFSDRENTLQSSCTVIQAFGIGESLAIATEGNYVRDVCLSSCRNEAPIDLLEGVMMLETIESAFDAAKPALVLWGGSNGAGESKGFNNGDFFRVKEVDSTQAHASTALAEFLQ